MTAEETKKRHHDVIVNLEATYREIDQKTRRCVGVCLRRQLQCERADSGEQSASLWCFTRLMFSTTVVDAPVDR